MHCESLFGGYHHSMGDLNKNLITVVDGHCSTVTIKPLHQTTINATIMGSRLRLHLGLTKMW